MPTSILWTLWCAALAGCVVGAAPADGATDPARKAYLAAIEELASPDVVRASITRAGGQLELVWPRVGILRFTATPAQAATLLEQPGFLAIERVDRVQDGLDEAWRPTATRAAGLGTQTVPWGVTRVGGAAPASNARLWVFDTGVDLDHPDLRVDREQSADIVADLGGDSEPETSHGTAVAGVAAALDNDRDVVGVAAGALVVSIRVLDQDGVGHTDVLIAGLEHAISRADPGDVFNLSLAAPGGSEVLETAVARVANHGIAVVLAAGNSGRDAGTYTPAGIEHDGVYTVSAIGQDDCLTSFSNYGSVIDVAAPGMDILTLRAGGGTVVYEGTSFAAPHVAGLLLSGRLSGDGSPCADADDSAEPIAHR